MLNHTLYTCNCSVRGHDIPYFLQVQIKHYKDYITVHFGDIITVQQ